MLDDMMQPPVLDQQPAEPVEQEPVETATPEFWRGEIQRSRRASESFHQEWQENLDYYTGKSPDAARAYQNQSDWVNVNADFYQVEVKAPQLFYETPDLQLTAKGAFKPIVPAGMPAQPLPGGPILMAHRELLNQLLGDEHADALSTVLRAIKDCLCPSGFGATLIFYEPTMKSVQPPVQPGMILGPLDQAISVPIYEKWGWDRIELKKFRKPADFRGADHDKAPWLAYDFRMPWSLAQRMLDLPPDYEPTTVRDEKVLKTPNQTEETSQEKYVEGTLIWYYAAIYDSDVIHPLYMRRHIMVEGVDRFVEKTTDAAPGSDPRSPYQTLLPDGRLSADSMIGNPIHVLNLRDVPDSSDVPSDCTMTRPLVRELCTFRTQMVQERDANRALYGYDVDKLPPETIARIENRSVGSLVGLEGGALAQGQLSVIAPLITPTNQRQTYLANDYITRDLEKTLGIDATGVGVGDGDAEESATKTAEETRNRNVRLDAERRRVLQWYLKGVRKFSALVCRFMTPQMAVPYIGQESAQTWGQWDKRTMDGRLIFDARPDSQIRLDAAAERKYALQLYQMVAKDPNVVRVELLKDLFQKAGRDPGRLVVDKLPEKPPEPNLGFTFKGEDLIGPQGPMVREIIAQCGIQVSQTAVDESAGQLFKQVALGIRDANGKAVPPTQRLAEHGGPADKVRPLSQQSADQTGNRPGAPTGNAA